MNDFIAGEAIKIWYEFYEQILHTNRFFPRCKLIDLLDEIIEKNISTLNKGEVFYRARLYKNKIASDYNFKGEYEFYGYNKENSAAPPSEKAGMGRANPRYISYLYVSKDKYTAIAEVRPLIMSEVSVAEMKLSEDFRIIDFSNAKDIFYSENIIDEVTNLVGYEFSKPIDSEERYNYILTQYIAEYIKGKGFDGLMYRSSLSRDGKNMVLFNKDKAEPVSSKVYKIENMVYSPKCVKPKDVQNDEDALPHKKY